MNIAVCVKQVPDTTEIRIDPETNTLIREGVPSILNPDDAHATEEAVRLRERYGGVVTVISMGPPQAVEALRTCVSLGADRAILLSDRAFAGADTWATSYTLAAAIRKLAAEAPLDLVLCGRQAIDGDTAQVGPGLAQRLGYAQVTYVAAVEEINLSARRLSARRRLDNGVETVEARLPALLTCIDELNEIRYATMPNMIRAARYDPEVWRRADLDVEDERLGLKGSATVVSRIFAPPARPPGEMIPGDDAAAAANALADRMVAAAARLHSGSPS